MKVVVTIALMAAMLVPIGDALAQTAAISTSIPPTARANGMGEAYVAIADDATAAWWNPAGLGFLNEKMDASATRSQLVPDLADDVYYNFFALSLPAKGWGTFAASIVYLTYGTSEARGQSGESLGEFTSFEVAPALSYGFTVADQLGLGVTFKFIHVSLSPDLPNLPGNGQGSTVAADLGILYKLPGDLLSLGAAIQNLGPGLTFVTEDRSDPIYRNLKIGAAVNVVRKEKFGFLVTGDFNQLMVKGDVIDGDSRYPKPIYNVGAEARISTDDFVLAGQLGYVHDDEGAIKDPTYGVGFGYKVLQLDIASIPQAGDDASGSGGLDRVTKITLGGRF